jgi:hypothetical protein
MDTLYEQFHNSDFNRRLEISRNFVRFLVELKSFVPQDNRHKIQVGEHCALKLKQIIRDQNKERATRDFSPVTAAAQ